MSSIDPGSSSRALNPGMVYRPVSPPSNQLDAGHEDQKPIKTRFNLVAILRFLIVVFDIAATCKVLSQGGVGTVVVVIILEYISLGWNVLQLVGLWIPKHKGGIYWRLRVGKLNFTCGSEDEDPAERAALLEDGGDGKKELFKLGPNIFDLVLALLLVIFIPIDARNFYWHAAFTGLSFTIFALELIVGVLSIFRVFRGATIEIYPDQSSAEKYQYQIRLPVPEAQKAQGKQISVVAEEA